jgi:hypothetical protein
MSSWQLRGDLRKIKKIGILKEKRFFQLLSEQNNYVDNKMSKDFYMGFVRLLTKELRENGIVRLPYLFDLILVKLKDKRGIKNVGGKNIVVLQTGLYKLSFYPNKNWRGYFRVLAKNLNGKTGLDPRERLLGKKL